MGWNLRKAHKTTRHAASLRSSIHASYFRRKKGKEATTKGAHARGGAVVSIRARGLLQGSGQAFAALGIASIRRSGCDAWVDVGIPRKDGVGGDSGGLPPNPRSMASAYGVFFDAAHRVAY